MLKFTVTTELLNGTKETISVEVPHEAKFKDVIAETRKQGVPLGFGILTINGVVIPKRMKSATLDSRVTKSGKIHFVEKKRRRSLDASEAIDLDSL